MKCVAILSSVPTMSPSSSKLVPLKVHLGDMNLKPWADDNFKLVDTLGSQMYDFVSPDFSYLLRYMGFQLDKLKE